VIKNPKEYAETKSVHIYLSEEDFKKLQDLSDKFDISKSKVVSRAINLIEEAKSNESRDT